MAAGAMSLGSPSDPHLALLVKVARYYHEQGMSQSAIASKLHMSQSRVSRMLAEAVSLGIVRTSVVPPMETFGELESELCVRFDLLDAVVVDTRDADDQTVMRLLGAVAGPYLDATLTGNDRIGISSWSATLLAMVESMGQSRVRSAAEVVQLIGGTGRPEVQLQATRLASQLARLTRADLHLLAAPGLLPNRASRDALFAEPYVSEVAERWAHLTTALLGVGSLQPSELMHSSGNSVSAADMEQLRELGAVGDVCQRFFDIDGRLVDAEFHERVLGIGMDELGAIARRIGVAGGHRKVAAIRGALNGRLINVLITDHQTAEQLV